ncbi:unnamed protein product [Clavelina lepadiformis]|uniref:Mediator of RNA polymerase II transcription subunit 23 n=1 Tax=Clavelina lepadiformis TaxID=159417 RepID=A0ABP0FEU7_CLALP
MMVKAVCDAIEHLIDPGSYLLPGYLAQDEIRQNIPEEQPLAPWPLNEKLTRFMDRFRATATMVSTTGRWMLLPVVDHAFYQTTSSWRLEPDSLKFSLKPKLPYSKEMCRRQGRLLRYILRQTYSRDMVLQVLGFQRHVKQRCISLEVELVDLIVVAMQTVFEESDDNTGDTADQTHLMWQHISSQVIFIALYQFGNFSQMVELIYSKLCSLKQDGDICRGREHLMWCLLQFISGSIQKNSFADFAPVDKLIHLLYPENEPLPLPDMSKPSSIWHFSAMCILMHINRKAQSLAQTDSSQGGGFNLEANQQWVIPVALQKQNQFLLKCLQNKNASSQDYQTALLCNACNTTTDYNPSFTLLVENVYGESGSAIQLPGSNCVAFNKTAPLKMQLLDSLTAHTKMSMLHSITSKITKLAQTKSICALSPALVETYSRLMVYTEIESLGIKGLVTQVFPKICESRSWGILNTLLEIINYRMHHIQPAFRIQLLNTLHNQTSMQLPMHNQLLFGVESTALRLIMGLDNFDIKPQLVRSFSDQKQIVSQKSEELNRVLVLTLARSIHITGSESISGSWCIDILEAIMAATPHRWPQQTLKCFPHSVQEYFQRQTVGCVNKKLLKSNIEKEYVKWNALLIASTQDSSSGLDETDALAYFSLPTTPPYFICLLWKVFFEGKTPSPLAYKVLDGVNANQLSDQVRTFSDFLVYEFSVGDGSSEHVKICANVLRDMVWKYNIVFIDRLILCLALRSSETSDVQVANFIIQYLLIKPDDFRNRVRSFVQEVESTDHWNQSDWYSKHMAFHQKYPEMYYFEGLLKHCSGGDQVNSTAENPSSNHQYLPSYFSNITLRFLPVLDIVIHRCLESTTTKSLETCLDVIGMLYKFHDQPITYLFNTLHYYEYNLRERPSLKKKLVSTIVGAVTEKKPADWALSHDFMKYVKYSGKDPLPFTPRDWRFNEFPNASAYALHVTCVEILALPLPGDQVGQALIDVVLKMHPVVSRDDIFSWMNSVALILTALPEIFWKPLHRRLFSTITCDTLKNSVPSDSSYPYHILSYSKQQLAYTDLPCTRLLALSHIVWYHMSIGQLSLVSQFLKEEMRPLIETELQLLYVFHLIGPYFHRFRAERTRCLMDVASVLYDMLLNVSNCTKEICFVDEISDFLYHVKYMHIGTALNEKVEEVVGKLQPTLKKRLQFITQASSATAGRQHQQLIYQSSNPPT